MKAVKISAQRFCTLQRTMDLINTQSSRVLPPLDTHAQLSGSTKASLV